jgi:hypothetical protein
MDIAAIATIMNQGKVMQQASLSVMKMTMDTSMQQANNLKQMMEQSVNPNLGGNIDIQL